MDPLQTIADAVGGLTALAWAMGVLFFSTLGLGALCAVLAAFFPAKLARSAQNSAARTFRVTLLGAINVLVGLFLSGALLKAGGPVALLGIALLGFLASLASLGLGGLAWSLASKIFPEKEARPLWVGIAGSLLACSFVVPVLGQFFLILCLFCAVGSATLSKNQH